MNLWQERGLDAIIKEPEKWLRDALYPTINESRKEYQKTKESATFAKKYLNRLAKEYMLAQGIQCLQTRAEGISRSGTRSDYH